MNAERRANAVEFGGLTVVRGGREVLHGIEGSFAVGHVTGLFGPSGSGKSTLIRAIAGVQSGVRGKLDVLGAAPGSAAVRRALGYMTQAPSVYEDLTVAENVRYFAAVRGGAVGPVLERVQLEPWSHQLVRNLSGGQWARVSLAAALVGSPRLLLLDEPTVGLDPLLEGRIVAQLSPSELSARTGTTDLDEAFIRLIERP